MVRNNSAGNNRIASRCPRRFGFAVSIGTIVTALIVTSPCAIFAQSPLTVQPSTGRVGIGNTNPSEALDVTGTVKATAFKGDGTGSGTGSAWGTGSLGNGVWPEY